LIRFIGIIGLKRVLRFIRNFSMIRAGSREAARVLAQVLWASGLGGKQSHEDMSHWRKINPNKRNNTSSIKIKPIIVMILTTLTTQITLITNNFSDPSNPDNN
jgi:hypothetical protein